jgi:hypothetical protein
VSDSKYRTIRGNRVANKRRNLGIGQVNKRQDLMISYSSCYASTVTVEKTKARTYEYPILADRHRCRVIVPKYGGDLSTADNYTCLLVAFRDVVMGESES